MTFLERIHPETNPPVDSVAVLIPVAGTLRKPTFLIAERLSGLLRGNATFPGGTLLSGERPKRGAIRETREETGLVFDETSVIPAQQNPSIERWMGAFHNVYLYFGFVKDSRRAKHVETSKLSRWLAVDEEELIRLVERGKIHSFILNGWWQDVLHDIRYA